MTGVELKRRDEVSDVEIAELRDEEAISVQDLIYRTIDVSYVPEYESRNLSFFKNQHDERSILERSRKGKALVAKLDGRIIGTGSIVNNEIIGVFVDPDMQSRGVGRRLMSALENMSDSMIVELSVSLPSVKFYERLGYQDFTDRQIELTDGDCIRFYTARKYLSGTECG